MEIPKSISRQTRKVKNYEAMNGTNLSDSSDDEFIINTKISKPSTNTSKALKFSKLKLGSRRETKLPKCDQPTTNNVAELMPISDEITQVVHPSIIASPKIVEDLDFSIVAELDLTHRIPGFQSQETVIISSCDCLSSHELTNSSDSEIEGTTIELSATRKKKLGTEDNDNDMNLKPMETNEDKITKRRMISESNLNKTKKIKMESNEKQNTFLSEESISKLGVDDTPVLPQLSIQSSPLKIVNMKLPIEQPNKPNLIASLNEDIETPIVPQDKKIKVPEDNHNLLAEDEKVSGIPKIIKHVPVASNEFRSAIESSKEQIFTSKTAKGATKNELKRNLSIKKKTETNLKGDLAKRSIDNSDNQISNEMMRLSASKPIATTHSPKVDGRLRNDNLNNGFKMVSPKNIQTTQDPVHIFKSPSPPSNRVAVKWKPPGKAGGIGTNTFSNGNSPATGIRLGLSRNRRASKQLHPDVKVNI